MFTAKSEEGKTIFYTFEILAAVVAVIFLFLALYTFIDYVDYSFMSALGAFLSYVAQGITYSAVVFGIGKLIDLKCAKNCCKKEEEKEE